LSKPVFAYGVFKLCQQGVLDLDMPLAQLYHDPAIHDPQAMRITARHVLSHTTGFPNWREDVDQAMLIPQAVPGTRFGYSGEGFEYLQRVVEHVTGQPLYTLLTTEVLAPLGMHHSRFGWGVDRMNEALLDADGIAAPTGESMIASAAWSLLTTAADYARFLGAMLNPGHDRVVPLSATSVAAMLTPQVSVGSRSHLQWGLGWGLQETARGAAFWHWGGPQNNYTSYTATLITQRKGVVILTNSATGLRVCKSIAELVLACAQPAFEWLLPEERWRPSGE
jgi:CubicO group peptidase (beta-lactamase class C family)